MTGLFDMDGTLFDYEGQLRRDLLPLMSPGEEMPEDLWDESIPHIKARMSLIKSVPGWWRKLPKFQLGWDVFNLAKQIGFENHILTKGPKLNAMAWAEKVQCIADHFGPEINIDVVGKDKSGRYGRFLCDDYPDYIHGWLSHRPRGLVIMPSQPCNINEKPHPSIIRYDGTNLEEVKRALWAVYLRKDGEPWQNYL